MFHCTHCYRSKESNTQIAKSSLSVISEMCFHTSGTICIIFLLESKTSLIISKNSPILSYFSIPRLICDEFLSQILYPLKTSSTDSNYKQTFGANARQMSDKQHVFCCHFSHFLSQTALMSTKFFTLFTIFLIDI